MLLNTACNDEFLEEKRDYSVFGPEDIFQDPNQANAVFGSIYKKILGKYSSPLCGSDILMRQAQDNMGEQISCLPKNWPVDIPLV